MNFLGWFYSAVMINKAIVGHLEQIRFGAGHLNVVLFYPGFLKNILAQIFRHCSVFAEGQEKAENSIRKFLNAFVVIRQCHRG